MNNQQQPPPPSYHHLCAPPPPPATTASSHSAGGGGGMSLNVHLTVPVTSAGGADGSHTPNTPEILNSIVNMTHGPFTGFVAPQQPMQQGEQQHSFIQPLLTVQAPSPLDPDPPAFPLDSQGGCSTPSSCSSAATTPTSPASELPPHKISVEHYRSQFIKEGLKLKVRQKMVAGNKAGAKRSSASGGGRAAKKERLRKVSEEVEKEELMEEVEEKPSTSAAAMEKVAATVEQMKVDSPDDSDDLLDSKANLVKIKEELTPEDELRRQRRRERNKVAATKCRNKKKAHTQLLVKESDVLVTQNASFKLEIEKLEADRQRLLALLAGHEGQCVAPNAVKRQQQSQSRLRDLGSEDMFRVPLPPASSASMSVPTTMGAYLFPPEPAEVKPELPSPDEQPILGGSGGFGDFRDSCGFDPGDSASSSFDGQQQEEDDLSAPGTSSNGAPFLGKRSLSFTYLDLDSRCIAL